MKKQTKQDEQFDLKFLDLEYKCINPGKESRDQLKILLKVVSILFIIRIAAITIAIIVLWPKLSPNKIIIIISSIIATLGISRKLWAKSKKNRSP